MSRYNPMLNQEVIEDIAIWQAATGDGYWEDAANRDMQYVYLLGQRKAMVSFHASYGNKTTLRRIKELDKLIEENRKDAAVNVS